MFRQRAELRDQGSEIALVRGRNLTRQPPQAARVLGHPQAEGRQFGAVSGALQLELPDFDAGHLAQLQPLAVDRQRRVETRETMDDQSLAVEGGRQIEPRVTGAGSELEQSDLAFPVEDNACLPAVGTGARTL